MIIKWYHILFVLLAIWLAFLGGYARADVLTATQEIVFDLNDLSFAIYDEFNDVLDEIVPFDNTTLYINGVTTTTTEVGIIWTF